MRVNLFLFDEFETFWIFSSYQGFLELSFVSKLYNAKIYRKKAKLE